MITRVISVTTEFNKCPSDEDILECIEMAKLENCIIQLNWTLQWSGPYCRYIYPENTLEQIKDSLPKIYGI